MAFINNEVIGMNRNQMVTRIGSLSETEDSPMSPVITPEQGLEMMWRLALDTWAFMKETHAESRLQRHVVRLVRGKS
jgi:hypothetical protein